MRILITGSSGLVGTNLALRCLAAGHEVRGIDCRPSGWTDRFPCEVWDLRAGFPVPGWIGGRPDVVVHLAAHAKVHDLVLHPERALENVAMTHHVLEYCRAVRVPVVLASSREVYGDVRAGAAEEGSADFAATKSAYAASKVASEALVYALARCHGIPYLVFRLSNVYGPYDGDLERMLRVVPLFVDQLEHDEPVTVFGREKVLDFTYVDDCVAGLLAGLERLVDGRVRDETINVASGTGATLLDLVEQLGRALGVRPRTRVEPARTGEVTRYVADLRKARALLGYAPQFVLAEGIPRAVAWHRAWTAEHPRAVRRGQSGCRFITIASSPSSA